MTPIVTHARPTSNRGQASGAAMRATSAALAYVVLFGNAIAAPGEYAVDGLAVGKQLNRGSVHLIGNTSVAQVTNSTDLHGARKNEVTNSDEGPISRPIRSCIRGTEISYTSIALKNRHFSIRRTPKSIYRDIRTRLVSRHA